jgi:hypothetical protein
MSMNIELPNEGFPVVPDEHLGQMGDKEEYKVLLINRNNIRICN